MAFCKGCGSELPEGANNCPKCGAPVNGGAATVDLGKFAGNDESANYSREDIEQNKIICVLAYLSVLFFLPLVACPDSKYGRFHANQALLLLIAGVVCGVITGIFNAFWIIPVLGAIMSIIGGVIGGILGLATFVLMIIGMVNAGSGKAAELPVIGKIRIIK